MPGMEGLIYSAADLGAIIRRRRRGLGYTQTDLAEFNGCSTRFISELERGVAAAKLETVIHIANSIGIDLVARERGDVTWH